MTRTYDPVTDTKLCRICKERKPASDFYPHKTRGLRDECKTCKKTIENARYQAGNRAFRLKSEYGVSAADLQSRFEEQGRCCAICHVPCEFMPEGKASTAVVDHDHRTGSFRGLLCHACNRMLGSANDNTETLLSAVAYLLQHEGE